MAGGWSDMSDVNSASFQNIVSFAAKKISEASNSLYLFKPVEVLNAKRQVSFRRIKIFILYRKSAIC